MQSEQPKQRWLGFHRAAVEIHAQNPAIDKETFAKILAEKFGLRNWRNHYYAKDFQAKFSYSKTAGFSNCVVSLESIKNADNLPLLVCLLRPTGVSTYLANSTFIKRVSYGSKKLTTSKIIGTILGHDIMKKIGGIKNSPENFEQLFQMHVGLSWKENLERIVAKTNPNKPQAV